MSQDPSVVLQSMLGMHMGGLRVPSQQFTGILDAVILDTDATNAALSVGYCRVTIASLDSDIAYGPARYPGATAPPDGTNCVVAFIAPQINSATTATVRVLSLEGFGPADVQFATGVLTMPDSTGGTASSVAAVNGGVSDLSYFNLTSGIVNLAPDVAFGQTAINTNAALTISSARSSLTIGRVDGTSTLYASTINTSGSGSFYQFVDYVDLASTGFDLSIGSDNMSIVSAAGGPIIATAQIEVQYAL